MMQVSIIWVLGEDYFPFLDNCACVRMLQMKARGIFQSASTMHRTSNHLQSEIGNRVGCNAKSVGAHYVWI